MNEKLIICMSRKEVKERKGREGCLAIWEIRVLWNVRV